MLGTILTAAVAYTSLEIAYWYYRWWTELKGEPLPIVKSLLFAIFMPNLMFFFVYSYHLYQHLATSIPELYQEPQWIAAVWLARVLYLVPVWKQKLKFVATPQMYLLRLAAFVTVAVLMGMYV